MKKVKLSLLAITLSLGLAIPTVADMKIPDNIGTMSPVDAYKKGYEDGLKTANSSNTSNTKKSQNSGNVSKEFQSALKKAEFYAKEMHWSKEFIKEYLVTQDKFKEDAAQYVYDSIEFDFKSAALEKAKFYSNEMNWSSGQIEEYLVSQDKFTQEEATDAIKNLE